MIRPRRTRPLRQRMSARRDRLRGLAQAHVVGQEQPALGEEPLDALALIGIERALQALEPLADLGGRSAWSTISRSRWRSRTEQGADRGVVAESPTRRPG